MKKLLAILVIMSFILTGCSQDVEKNINTEEIQSRPSGEIKDIPKDENKESGENKEDIKASGEIQKEEEIKTEIIQTSTSTLSNQKCAWGFRRMKENKQPEFSSVFTKPLDEYNGIYVGNKDEKVIYLTLYEDVILKYDLLIKKEVDLDLIDKIIEENKYEDAFETSVSYIETKMRNRKEIIDYLRKKEFNEKHINYALDKLDKLNLLNDKKYIEAFINDKVNLTLDGPFKIKKALL